MVQIRILERFSVSINGGAAKFLPDPGFRFPTGFGVLPRWEVPDLAYRRTLRICFLVKFSVISVTDSDPQPFNRKYLINSKK